MTPSEIISWCQDYVAELLDIPSNQVDPDREIDDFGLDSAVAVSMVLDLETKLNRDLEPGILFEHGTLRKLALALCETAPTVAA